MADLPAPANTDFTPFIGPRKIACWLMYGVMGWAALYCCYVALSALLGLFGVVL